MPSLKVVNRDGKEYGVVDLAESATLPDLKHAFAKIKKVASCRQYFTIEAKNAEGKPEKIALKDETKPLVELLQGQTTVTFKDLGPQVGWRTVFLVEYAGPILAHSIFYWLSPLIYGQQVQHSLVQKLAYAMVVIHYLKREFESVFVHRFSNDTMPFMNIFKNSFHYWGIGGAFIAYYVYHPLYTSFVSDNVAYACVAAFLLMELGNLSAHITLRNLRPANTKVRGVPRGGLFGLVSCANYTYELGAWLAFCVMTQAATSWLFLLVSFAQITEWALKKHSAYRKEFSDYPKSRKALIPFIL